MTENHEEFKRKDVWEDSDPPEANADPFTSMDPEYADMLAREQEGHSDEEVEADLAEQEMPVEQTVEYAEDILDRQEHAPVAPDDVDDRDEDGDHYGYRS